jgi:4-diphosphocytidyl-2-C-methyl-D-erythritol kinase
MVAFPPCKINLGLNVTGKRPDGFHSIQTCFYPVPWHDILEILPAKSFSFDLSGEPVAGRADTNLCVKAYAMLKKEAGLPPVSIHLHKIIPIGAGLGGGSADAAYTLRILNTLFEGRLATESLYGYASQLGSDCAFFLEDRPLLASGRGEVLSNVSVSLKGKFLVIVNPGIHVSTAEAYAAITPKLPANELRDVIENYSPRQWKGLLVNDFEALVFKKFPATADIHGKLYDQGALYASLSGSGSSVYGIFEKALARKIHFENMVTWSGYLP